MNMEYDGDCVPIVLDREPSLKGEKSTKNTVLSSFGAILDYCRISTQVRVLEKQLNLKSHFALYPSSK